MTDATEKPSDVPIEKTCLDPVEWLVFDRRNPRLVGIEEELSGDFEDNNKFDVKVIAQLLKGHELSELLQSISTNGYLDIEPLIVMEDADKLIVLEGNRRLAAIRLFREPGLIDPIREQERVRIDPPQISDKVRPTLEEVSIYRVKQRADARSFIGFKHINGAAKWDSYAKARFAADWYRSGDASLEQIAPMIGDAHETIKRMVNAIYVLEQAEHANIFNISDRINPKFNFSHLYTALSRTPYMEFLGLDTTWASYNPNPDPVPEAKVKNLREVLIWIYGSKKDGVQPVIRSQNPDIKRLGELLQNAEGLNVLKVNRDLELAHARTIPVNSRLTEGLVRAQSLINDVAGSLRGFDGKDLSLVDIAKDIEVTIQAVLDHMHKKVDQRKKAHQFATDDE